jgi:hypothetical protein
MRVCSSHSAVNKMTAKASLQQLLSYVFTRMEQCDKRLKAAAAAAAATEPTAAGTDAADTTDSSDTTAAAATDAATADTAAQSNGDATTAAADSSAHPIASTPDRARHSRHSSVATVEEAVVQQPLQCPAGMYAAVFEQQQFAALYTAAAAVADSATASSGSSATADGIGEFEDEAEEIDPHERLEQRCGAFPSLLHRDAFLLFRALCKLSMKAEGADDSSSGGSSGAAAVAPDSAATEARQVRRILLCMYAAVSVL